MIAALIAVAAAAPAYPSHGYGQNIAIVRASDERHGVQSSNWRYDKLFFPNCNWLMFFLLINSYEGSDGTTRQESNAQKGLSGYGNDGYGNNGGNTNQGSSYWVTPEGHRLTLTWVADENGFQPRGDHLPQPVPLLWKQSIGHSAY